MTQTDSTTPSVSDRSSQGPLRGLLARWQLRNSPALEAYQAVRQAMGNTTPPASQRTPDKTDWPDLLKRLLAVRNITDPKAIEAFVNPSMLQLHDPSMLPGCDTAAERILQGLARKESIVIYGDYDVDGITASSILWHTIKTISPDANLGCYVPHRLDEGYGLNAQAIQSLANEGTQLIVSVDCGISATAEAALAQKLDLDLIITDHHNLPQASEHLPNAYALVHPRLPGSDYPFGQLCGAGVAYKLAWRLLTMHEGKAKLSKHSQRLLLELLGLVSLGTIADVVPLVDENRVLVHFGLGRLKTSKLVGVRALLEASNLDKQDIDAHRVAFILAPRLNACGRLGHAREVVHMLTMAPYEEAFAMADELNGLNADRRKVEKKIVEQAIDMVQQAGMDQPDTRAIVLAHDDWHKGVVGIACSRLVERFSRPVILLAREKSTGVCAGSGRSVAGVNLHAALAKCDRLLESWGGHDMAAGLSCTHDNLEAFAQTFIDTINDMLLPNELCRTIRYDCQVSLDMLDLHTVQLLEGLGPFGAANPTPRFLVRQLTIAQPPRQVGKNGAHLSLRFKSEQTHTHPVHLKCIAWRMGDLAAQLAQGMRVDAIITPTISTWNGTTSVEAQLHDLKPL